MARLHAHMSTQPIVSRSELLSALCIARSFHSLVSLGPEGTRALARLELRLSEAAALCGGADDALEATPSHLPLTSIASPRARPPLSPSSSQNSPRTELAAAL